MIAGIIASILAAGGGPTDTGWVASQSIVDQSDVSEAWSNLANAEDNGAGNQPTGTFATNAVGDGSFTNTIYCTDFAFAVPSGATIDGIEIRQRLKSAGSNDVVRTPAYVLLNSVESGTGAYDNGSISGTVTDYDSGGASSLLGTSPTAGDGTASTDVNNSGFGVALQYLEDDEGGSTVSLDAVFIKVHYTT